jgi:hypothetical protein
MVQMVLRDQQVLQVLLDRKDQQVLLEREGLQVQPERQAQALILLALMLFLEEIQILPRFQRTQPIQGVVYNIHLYTDQQEITF